MVFKENLKDQIYRFFKNNFLKSYNSLKVCNGFIKRHIKLRIKAIKKIQRKPPENFRFLKVTDCPHILAFRGETNFLLHLINSICSIPKRQSSSFKDFNFFFLNFL